MKRKNQTTRNKGHPKNKSHLISKQISEKLYSWFLTLWTAAEILMTIFEFLELKIFFIIIAVPDKMPLGYFIWLLVYGIDKETKRWMKKRKKKRKGELFFWIWWFLLLTLFVVSSFSDYKVSFKTIETCIYVSIVYFGTLASKIIYQIKRGIPLTT